MPARSAAALRRRVAHTARTSFGYDELRPGQVEAIEALLEGSDVLVVMPTGAGKSAVYQIAALLIEGPTVVVSPLIALQHDQVAGLEDSPDGTAAAMGAVVLNSAQSRAGTAQAWTSLRRGTAEFVFLSPEQLAKDDVVDALAELHPSLLVVDEAHCIASWGHDFRPDYLRIGDVRSRLGDPVVAALTATAAPPVRDEIVARMRMVEPHVIAHGFDRPNLFLEVQHFADDTAKRGAVVAQVRSQAMPGLLYTGTRKDTEFYAEALVAEGLRARAYHAGLRAAERTKVHEQFLGGELEVVVATTAFGMGIDKADVRFVVHAHIAESLDGYYQEIGRAGRDGRPARVTLMYREQDLGLRRFLGSGGPDVHVLGVVARALVDAPSSKNALVQRVSLPRAKVINALNLLELAGVVRVSGRGQVGWADGGTGFEDGVRRALDTADQHRRVQQSRLEMMRAYAETRGCRRQLLLGYFGEALDHPCQCCDGCERAQQSPLAEAEVARSTPFPMNARVLHREWGPGIVMHPQQDRVTVLFETEGYKTLELRAVVEHEVLRLADTG